MIEPEQRRFTYDTEVDAAYLHVSSGRIAGLDAVADGMIVDRDRERMLVGMEALDVRRRVGTGDLLSDLRVGGGARRQAFRRGRLAPGVQPPQPPC